MKAPLAEAPDHIKLAVDLIVLLEQQQIAPQTMLAALELVVKDTQQKIKQQSC